MISVLNILNVSSCIFSVFCHRRLTPSTQSNPTIPCSTVCRCYITAARPVPADRRPASRAPPPAATCTQT